MSNDEIRDRQLGALLDQAADLKRDFQAALDHLRPLSEDFSPGAQQHWLDAWHTVRAVQDERWRVAQAIAALEQHNASNPT